MRVFTKLEDWLLTKLLARMVNRERGNLNSHARRELVAIGYDPNDKTPDPNLWMQENILELLAVFSRQGHSGFSAPHCVQLFEKLAQFKPLGPLTGADSEWGESFCHEGTLQNKRCSHVFKDADGRAYDIDGRIFRYPNGGCSTRSSSHVFIEFPYTPTSVYVDVDEDGNEIVADLTNY